MNRYYDHVENPAPRDALPPVSWRWMFAGHLLMLAGFVGLSLVVIALTVGFEGAAGYGRDQLLTMGLVGTALVAIAWLGVVHVLRNVDAQSPPGGTRPGRGMAGTTGASAL